MIRKIRTITAIILAALMLISSSAVAFAADSEPAQQPSKVSYAFYFLPTKESADAEDIVKLHYKDMSDTWTEVEMTKTFRVIDSRPLFSATVEVPENAQALHKLQYQVFASNGKTWKGQTEFDDVSIPNLTFADLANKVIDGATGAEYVEQLATEPTTTEPVTTEPVTTEPATTEPVTTEPVTTAPATTVPVTTVPPTTVPQTEPFTVPVPTVRSHTFYYLPKANLKSGQKVRFGFDTKKTGLGIDSWSYTDMTDSKKTIGGVTVYKVTFKTDLPLTSFDFEERTASGSQLEYLLYTDDTNTGVVLTDYDNKIMTIDDRGHGVFVTKAFDKASDMPENLVVNNGKTALKNGKAVYLNTGVTFTTNIPKKHKANVALSADLAKEAAMKITYTDGKCTVKLTPLTGHKGFKDSANNYILFKGKTAAKNVKITVKSGLKKFVTATVAKKHHTIALKSVKKNKYSVPVNVTFKNAAGKKVKDTVTGVLTVRKRGTFTKKISLYGRSYIIFKYKVV